MENQLKILAKKMQDNKLEDFDIQSKDDELESDVSSKKSIEDQEIEENIPKVVKTIEDLNIDENSFEAFDEDNMTEEEIKELNEQRTAKQEF